MNQNTSDVADVAALQEKFELIKNTVGKIIIGQAVVVEQLVTSILCNGHSLLVGVPGLAKTLLVKTVADVMDLSFKRIQFTPDLMPSDITGTEILDENRHFKFIKGPIFANIILADEINRTPPKTQAALLEAMQERNVTASGVEYTLPNPFFVLATQNPIEQEGTYPLPEAQLDRFMFKIDVGYPTFQEEMEVVRQTTGMQDTGLEKVISSSEIVHFQKLIRKVPINDNVLEYAVGVVQKTRPNIHTAHSVADKYFSWGAGPRASQFLVLAAKCHAVLHGKFSPDIEDVKAVAYPVLQHRVVRNYKAEADGRQMQDLLQEIL